MSDYVPRNLHLIDPSELQLHLDPSLGAGLGTGFTPTPTPTPSAPAPNLIPSYTDLLSWGLLGGGPADAHHRLWEHYTDPPARPGGGLDLGSVMPRLPGGLDITGDGVGGTAGDFDFRFKPYIPGLIEPDEPPDPRANPLERP